MAGAAAAPSGGVPAALPAPPQAPSLASRVSEAWAVYGPHVEKALKEWPTWAMRRLKTVAHYGFVPLVIAVGMSYEPRPHILQLIGP